MQKGFILCESTKGVLPPAKFDPLLQRTRQHYDEVRGVAVAVTNLGKENSNEFQQVRDQYTNATAELANGGNALTTAMRSRSQKDFDSATAAIERAQSALITIQTRLSAAVGETSAALALAKEVEGLLAKGDEAERQVTTRLTDKKATLPGPLVSMRDAGREALTKARERYATGSKALSLPILTEARTQVTNGTNSYKQLLDELTKVDATELQNAISGAEQALLLSDGLIGTLAKRISAKPSLVDDVVAAEREKIVKEVDGARRRLAGAKAASNLDGINKAKNATITANEHLSVLLGRFGPLTLRERGVREALEEGSRQFFAGQYDKALAALNAPEVSAPDAPLQIHVHLFRAASLHAQYARSPNNQALRSEALAEVDECRKLDSAFEPDPRAFSPGFIRFFKTEHAPVATR
jgi:hypothetical protein